MLNLTGKQKRFLRAEAHDFSPMFQIGKKDLTEDVVNEYVAALHQKHTLGFSLFDSFTYYAELNNASDNISIDEKLISEAQIPGGMCNPISGLFNKTCRLISNGNLYVLIFV